MAIKHATRPICQFGAKPLENSSPPEMSSVEYRELLSPEKATRASLLKSRFADLISKAQQTLAIVPKDGAVEDLPQVTSEGENYEAPGKLKKTTSSRPDQVDVRRESKRRQEADHDQFLEIKKRRRIDEERDTEGDHGYSKKRRCCPEIRMQRETYNDHWIEKQRSHDRKVKTQGEGDQELKRRQEIERQREAARIAINNMEKTLDFDNLSVMVEFERLLCS